MAALYHVYTQTVADGTATSVVRPSDWNSAHFQQQTIAGNTAGRSTWSGTNLVLQGGNNVTLSINTNSTASTLIISAASQSAQTGSIIRAAQITGNTSGATASISSGTMILAGGNNITLSQNANAITISAGNPGIQRISFSGNTAGLSPILEGATATFNVVSGLTVAGISGSSVSLIGQNLGFGINTNANTTNFTAASLSYVLTGPVRFEVTGNISVSQPTLSQIRFSVAAPPNIAISGNTAGVLSTISDGTAVFAGGSNITLSQNGNGITINGAGFVNSGFNPYQNLELQASSFGNNSLMFNPVDLPSVSFDRLAAPVYIASAATSVTNTFALTMHVGIYNSNYSRVTSISTAISADYPSNGSLYNGFRLLAFTLNTTTSLPAGQYYIGVLSSTSNGGGGNGSVWNMLLSNTGINFSGFVGSTTAATRKLYYGQGVYSTTTNALPASVAASEIQGTNSAVFRPQPVMLFLGNP